MKPARLIYRLAVPGGIVLLLAFLLLKMGIISSTDSRQIQLYPAIIFLICLVLSATFHRSRLFLATLVAALAHAALVWFGPRVSPEIQQVLLNAVALLLPLNLLGFSFLQERGLISPAGERRLAFICVQCLAVVLLLLPRFGHLAALLDYHFVPQRFSNWSRLSQPALAAFLIALVVILIPLLRHYRVVESSLLWSLISIFIALRAGVAGSHSATYFGAAGLLFIVAVLETSYSMAYLDELTRLPGRRAFNEALLKLGTSYSIAMVDVDHFKKFNDTYGHAAGDQALRMVASKLAHVTAGGKAYRYGGEEFAILFPGRPAEEAFTYLDRMRRLIEQSPFIVRGSDRRRANRNKKSHPGKSETNVTVSVGIAGSNGNGVTVEQVLRSADKALYKAKARGRNCTIVARPPKPKEPANFAARILQVE